MGENVSGLRIQRSLVHHVRAQRWPTEHLLVPFLLVGSGELLYASDALFNFSFSPRNILPETVGFLVKSTFLPSCHLPAILFVSSLPPSGSRPCRNTPGLPALLPQYGIPSGPGARLADRPLHLQ